MKRQFIFNCCQFSQSNVLNTRSRVYQLKGLRYMQIPCDNRARWLISNWRFDWFCQNEYRQRDVLIKSVSNGQISRDLILFFIHWFNGIVKTSALVWVARPTVLKRVDRDLRTLPSLINVFWFTSPIPVDEVFVNIFRLLKCVMLWSVSISLNLERKDLLSSWCATVQSTAYSIGFSLKSGSSDWLVAKRGLLEEGLDAVSCPSFSVTHWMHTVL